MRATATDELQLAWADFERMLLLGDAAGLRAAGVPDAAAVAAGDVSAILGQVDNSTSSSKSGNRSARIAHECMRAGGASVAMTSAELTSALQDGAAGSAAAIRACYLAGVALLQGFLYENWAGPRRCSDEQSSEGADNEMASLLMATDGEDVATPVAQARWLRAAKMVLVDHITEFIQAGAALAPWWAARVLLAHHAILSRPTPTLQNDIFTMFGRFLGPDAAATRFLFGAADIAVANAANVRAPDSESDEDDFLLPAPTADGGEDFYDEEQDMRYGFDDELLEDCPLLVMAYLELALAQKSFYDGDAAKVSLERATSLVHIKLSVSGEMGVRTKFQRKSTAQLIARAFELPSISEAPRPASTKLKMCFPRDAPAANDEPLDEVQTGSDSNGLGAKLPLPRNMPLNDSDVLGYIKLTEGSVVTTEGEASDSEDDLDETEIGPEIEHLTPVEQALVLAHAAIVRARNAAHLLTETQMAPYVNLVLQNASSVHGTSSMVQIRALMLRASFESVRGRFLERCMSQMEEVGRYIDDSMPIAEISVREASAAERAAFVFSSSVPPRWELKKELAIALGRIGLVKSAMEIFKELEFWDELVDCHRLIGNMGAAEALVREQLALLDAGVAEDGVLAAPENESCSSVDPSPALGDIARQCRAVAARAARRPKLLCVLGDVTRDTTYFVTAWEESGHRYTRAKRALARSCVERAQWSEALTHFREALAINPLFPEVWFTYGCSAVEAGEMQLAATAFTHVVQQTPENGEAWNNLGRVLSELGKKKEALLALGAAAKAKRDSWRVWNNVLLLATELRSSLEIVRAMERLLEIRGKAAVASEPIGVAVSEVIRMSSSDTAEDKALIGPVCRRLLKVLGRSTALVSTNPSIWAAYSELHELVPNAGGKRKAFDCRLKQVRSLIAHAEWKTEPSQFRHMVFASVKLSKDAIDTGDMICVRAAKLHVESLIEQTSKDFSSNTAFLRLRQVLAELVAFAPSSSS